jgi:hypothetical protein
MRAELHRKRLAVGKLNDKALQSFIVDRLPRFRIGDADAPDDRLKRLELARQHAGMAEHHIPFEREFRRLRRLSMSRYAKTERREGDGESGASIFARTHVFSPVISRLQLALFRGRVQAGCGIVRICPRHNSRPSQ